MNQPDLYKYIFLLFREGRGGGEKSELKRDLELEPSQKSKRERELRPELTLNCEFRVERNWGQGGKGVWRKRGEED